MRVLAIALALLAVFVSGASSAAAESASNGPRTLTVSKATGLDPAGETISVSLTGFDEQKGVYIALCVIPAPGAMPSPCGGGGTGETGASGVTIWVSSNPPSYATGLPVPYSPGGTFSGTMTIYPVIGSVDCRVTACAITTRSDHTRLLDRSQDILIPVTFATPGQTPPAAPTPRTASPSPSASPAASPSPFPTLQPIVLSQDNRTATRGPFTLTASRASGLNPAGQQVTVTGRGFDTSRGIFVALCALKGENALGTCDSGSPETSAWISSNPPAYAAGRARAYTEGGAFQATLSLKPVIDERTDCRQIRCAIATRNDDTVTSGAPQEVLIPVTFAAEGPTPTAADAQDGIAGTATGGGDASNLPWVAGGAALLVLLAIAAFLLRRRAAASVTGLIAMALLFGACSTGGSPANTPGTEGAQLPVTVRSADGKNITITSNARIITLWGNITEVAVGLGLTSNIVGRDITSTGDEVAHLPEVTRAHDLSVEGVLSLNPTIVIGSKDNSGPAEAIRQIRNVGVPVVLIDDPKTVQDIGPRIRLIAKILGVPDRGEAMAAKAEAEVSAVLQNLPPDRPHPKVAFLYLRGNAGVYLIGGPGSGADSMIAAAGGRDAGTVMGLSNPFTPLTSEALARAAPDVILMSKSGLESVGGIDALVKIPGIAQTPAGKARAVITMGEDLLYNFGLRTPEAIQELSQDIYAAARANP